MISVKICCIANIEEAKMAIKYGAAAIGLVSEMPSGPGVIDEQKIKKIARTIPETISSFLLTSKRDPVEIVNQHKFCQTTTIQIVDQIPLKSYSILRERLPGISLVQVIHVRDQQSIQEAVKIAPFVDMLLLDSGNPDLKIKKLGGTGETHDWNISREIVDIVEKPVYLAGGLKPENVRKAVEFVQPFGVDVCSGVRIGGILNEEKLENFMTALS